MKRLSIFFVIFLAGVYSYAFCEKHLEPFRDMLTFNMLYGGNSVKIYDDSDHTCHLRAVERKRFFISNSFIPEFSSASGSCFFRAGSNFEDCRKNKVAPDISISFMANGSERFISSSSRGNLKFVKKVSDGCKFIFYKVDGSPKKVVIKSLKSGKFIRRKGKNIKADAEEKDATVFFFSVERKVY